MAIAAQRFDRADLPDGWTTAIRCDVGRLRKAERTAGGGVRVPGAVSCVGVLTYVRADGTTVREFVTPDELASPESIASLRDAPVTVGHPGGGARMVSPDTYRRDSVGHISGDPSVDDEHLVAHLAIGDAETIARMDADELVELSAGYSVAIDPTPGEYNGQRYDVVQRRRRYNHVALLPRGGARAGSSASLRVDGLDVAIQERTDSLAEFVAWLMKSRQLTAAELAEQAAVSVGSVRAIVSGQSLRPETDRLRRIAAVLGTTLEALEALVPPRRRANTRTDGKETTMATIRIDGVEYEAGSTGHLQAESKRFERVERERDEAVTRADAAEKKVEETEARLDEATAQRDEAKTALAEATDPKRLDAAVAARADIVAKASRMLGSDFRADGKTDVEIMRAALAKREPSLDLAEKSEDYIRARFDAAAEGLAERETPLDRARGAAFGNRNDHAPSRHAHRRPPINLSTRYRQ